MRLLMLVAMCLWLTGCGWFKKEPLLATPEKAGKIVVAIRSGPTSFYINPENNYAGIEYELVTRFANYLHLKAEFIVVADAEEARQKLEEGSVHIAALGLPVANDMPGLAAAAYQSEQAVLVVNGDYPKPTGLSKLEGKIIYVQAGTAYADQAKSLKLQHPHLTFKEVSGRDIEELLEYASLNKDVSVLTGSLSLTLAQQTYPNLVAAMQFSPSTYFNWQLRKDSSVQLQAQTKLFFQHIQYEGIMRQLSEQYYGHILRLARPDIEGFLLRRVKVMPQYRPQFQEAEARTGIDWRFLAAVAYQESHWDSDAISPAGARGVMMLTAGAADYFKVDNRHDASASIRAGAAYLQFLREKLDPDIAEPDRTWLALAAYNVGLGHLLDARELARRQGRNPDIWMDVRETLLMLREPRYYRTLKHGYARGSETVRYIESVRTYYDILVRFEEQFIPLFPPSDSRVLLNNPDNLRLEVDANFSSNGLQSLSKRLPVETASGINVVAQQ